MSEMGNTVSNESSQMNGYYTVSKAAKRLGLNYQKIIYAIAQGWLVPCQREPMILIKEAELIRYANDQKIEVPNS